MMKFIADEEEAELFKGASLQKCSEWNDKRNFGRAKLEVETERALKFQKSVIQFAWTGHRRGRKSPIAFASSALSARVGLRQGSRIEL